MSWSQMVLPTGRIERRIAKTLLVELLHVGESPAEKVKAITENVSPRGVRVITDSIWVPGKHVRLDEPEGGLKLPGRVVYCQRLDEKKFALGVQLEVRIEWWQKPEKP